MQPLPVVIVAFVSVWSGIVGCRERTPNTAASMTELPDPIVHRLGVKKAREIHLAGVRGHIADVRRSFGNILAVRSQCDAAEALISDPDVLLCQRPLVLCAGSLDGDEPQFLLLGLNPNRETVGVVLYFSLHDILYSIRYERTIISKDEEITLALPLLPLRFVTTQEVEQLGAEESDENRNIVISYDSIAGDNPEIPVPLDIPVYVSIWDRSGLKSDVVPFQRSLRGRSEQGNKRRE